MEIFRYPVTVINTVLSPFLSVSISLVGSSVRSSLPVHLLPLYLPLYSTTLLYIIFLRSVFISVFAKIISSFTYIPFFLSSSYIKKADLLYLCILLFFVLFFHSVCLSPSLPSLLASFSLILSFSSTSLPFSPSVFSSHLSSLSSFR